ncbi:MAG: hypothetical protein R3B45_10260 [Bdellovibrionota bacterium]
MSDKPLTKAEWSKLIRDSLRYFAQSVIKERGAIEKTAVALDLSRASIEKMKSNGTGSVESWIKLAVHSAKMPPEKTKYVLTQLTSIVDQLNPPDELDLLFQETKKNFDRNELAAWMTLLLAKRKVENQLGIDVKAKLKSKDGTILTAAEKESQF